MHRALYSRDTLATLVVVVLVLCMHKYVLLFGNIFPAFTPTAARPPLIPWPPGRHNQATILTKADRILPRSGPAATLELDRCRRGEGRQTACADLPPRTFQEGSAGLLPWRRFRIRGAKSGRSPLLCRRRRRRRRRRRSVGGR